MVKKENTTNSSSSSYPFACWGVYSRECITRRTLARIADKWTILIVGRLSQQPYRFGELRRSIEGISSKILTEHLRELETDGLIKRLVEPTRPPSVTYSLTPLGESLVSVALTLKNWAEEHANEIEKIRQASNATNGFA
ncbi:helix-turn-helix transcriptional regulator [Phormidium tenue FACHB-886]|nr:helix-turn-helix transcriptional regulator [Phormidium tenue FACHB-886]